MVMAVALAESAVVPSGSIGCLARCSGQAPPTAPQILPATSVEMTPDQARQSVQWLADQLLTHVPDRFDGDDDWGNTKSLWAGVKVRREGWKLKTNRRRKEVRHGRWVRYDVTLPALSKSEIATPKMDPADVATGSDGQSRAVSAAGSLSGFAWPSALPISASSTRSDSPLALSPLTIRSVVPSTTPAGNPGWLVDAVVRTPARFHIRLERWNLGVQAFSLSVDGTMDVNLECQFVMGMSADYSEVPPAIQLDVNVEHAKMRMDRFNVERISKLGGDAAEELGNLAEDTLIRLWLKKENTRLADRLNEAIAKHQSDLRWSMMQWLGQWHSASLPSSDADSTTR